MAAGGTFLSLSLPLNEYVRQAIDQNAQVNKVDGGRSELWVFTRQLKARPELDGLDCFDAAEVVEQWLTEVSGFDSGDVWEFCFDDCADPRGSFCAAWGSVLSPGCGDALDVAWDRAQRFPFTLLKPLSKKYSQFVALSGHLQEIVGGDEIMLPVARLSKMLQLDAKQISNYRQLAKKQGFLRETVKWNKLQGKATRFIFDRSRIDWLCFQELTQMNVIHSHDGIEGTDGIEGKQGIQGSSSSGNFGASTNFSGASTVLATSSKSMKDVKVSKDVKAPKADDVMDAIKLLSEKAMSAKNILMDDRARNDRRNLLIRQAAELKRKYEAGDHIESQPFPIEVMEVSLVQ